MKSKSKFRQTLISGVFFILPLLLFIYMIVKIINMLEPIARLILRDSSDDTFIGVSTSVFVTIMLILLLCVAAGLFKKSTIGEKFGAWIDQQLLVFIPGYQFVKSVIQAESGFQSDGELKVVLAPMDGWVIGFLMEEINESEVSILIPGSPSPTSGTVVIYKKDQLRPTNISQREALLFLRQSGIGLKGMINYSDKIPGAD